MGKYTIMREDEAKQAKTYGFGDFFKGIKGSARKRRLYAALDAARTGLKAIKVDDTDGEAIAALAAAFAKSQGLLEYLHEKKIADLKDKSKERQFLEIFGRYAAEGYFKARKLAVSSEPSLLAFTVSRTELADLIRTVLSTEPEGEEVDAASLPEQATITEAADWLIAAFGRYESAIPPVGEDGSVPAETQDKGIAKAAFLGLRAKDLRKIVASSVNAPAKDELEAATREYLADRLAAEYAGKEQEIADFVLGGSEGAKRSGVVTRLIPLREAPTDLASVATRLERLKDRYYETGPAEWFCFRKVAYASGTLILTGDILGYQVGTTEVKEEARLQPTRRYETVDIRLRNGDAWAQTNARRAGSLGAIGRVLRRTELAHPKSLVAPEPIDGEPYSLCDSRTLWMLELLYRELSTDPFLVVDHIMVNFERQRPKQAVQGEGAQPKDKPFVTAVRLKGIRLIDHPEVCDLILNRRRVVEVEVSVRVASGKGDPQLAPRIRTRLTWADDHLALITSPLAGDYDVGAHNVLVRQLRRAATRQIDKSYIELPMQRVIVNSQKTESSDDLGSVLDKDDDSRMAS